MPSSSAARAAAAGGGPVAKALASMSQALEKRAKIGKLRRLPDPVAPGAADFTSNDYLGLARCPELARRVKAEAERVEATGKTKGGPFLGATGSRLLSGTTWYHAEVEKWMADFFRRESALVFNSGYDLNLGLLACLTRPGDAVLFDELIHNSSVMGLRLGGWYNNKQQQAAPTQTHTQKQGEQHPAGGPSKTHTHTQHRPWVFRHNDVQDLDTRLKEARSLLGPHALLFIAVESIYSMDGDVAPLTHICDTAARHGACVIVDEAHSTGIMGEGGRGLVCAEGLENHPALLCSIHTFGKALGCHGAVLCGPQILKDYCANYCAPFIYSTAASFHSLASMRAACAFQSEEEGDRRRARLGELVQVFQSTIGDALQQQQQTHTHTHPHTHQNLHTQENENNENGGGCHLLPSSTPIQAVLVPGNARCSSVAAALQASGLDVRPLRPPTVPEGKERLRVVLHAHNTVEEVERLAERLRGLVVVGETEVGKGRERGAGASSSSAAAAFSSVVSVGGSTTHTHTHTQAERTAAFMKSSEKLTTSRL